MDDALVPVDGGAQIQRHCLGRFPARYTFRTQPEVLSTALTSASFGIDASLDQPVVAGCGIETELACCRAHILETVERCKELNLLFLAVNPVGSWLVC